MTKMNKNYSDEQEEKVLTLQVQALLTQHSIIEVLIEMVDFFAEDANFVEGSTNDDYMKGLRKRAITELTSCCENIER